MRSLVFGFLLLFNASVFAATCSDIWPAAVSFPAPAAPTIPAGLSYSGVINSDTTFADGQTEFAVQSIGFNGNVEVNFEGTGTRVLYVQNALDIGGSSKINPNGNVDLVIIVGGAMNLNGNATVNAAIYVAGSSSASSSSVTVNGAVTSAGSTTVTRATVNYDANLVAAISTNNACEQAAGGLSYPYTTGFEGDNSEWDISGDFSISSDVTGERTPRTGSNVLDNNSEDIDQRRRYSGHTAEMNELIEIPADAVLPELSFFYKLSAIDSNDRFRVHIYRESTDSWRHVWSVNDEQNNTGYRYALVDLSAYKGERIKVRFQQRITSYASGARLFLVDDIAIQDRAIVDFSYPYTNGFEVGEIDDWYLSGDLTISNSGHNNWQANTGSGFLDNNANEISQRRHYTHHFAMMSGFVEIPNDADQPTVSFQYKIDVNDANDRYFVEIQQSDSTSWTRLVTLRSEDDIGQYAKFDYYLSDSYKGTKVRVRVRQYITSYDSSVRLFVLDDFRIGDKEVDDSLSYPYVNTFESVSEQSDWNARGDMNISTSEHDTDYVAYQGAGFIDNNPNLEDQRRHYLTHLIEMQKYVTLPNEDNIVLNFFYKLDVLDTNDRIFIEIQRAGSSNWSRIETLSEQHDHASYTKYEASLAAYKNDTIRIRFRQYITSYASGPRLFVADDFYIGPQIDTYFDFPYFNDFETDISVVNVNQDDSDDVNGRDQWNHEGDWDISGISDNTVDPERTSFSGDWYLNNNGAFDEDQRRHYINHEMSMAGYILVPADSAVPEASFFYKLDVIDSNDRFFFEYQIEGTSNWRRIQTFSVDKIHSTYTRYRYTLPDSLKGQYIRFRFRQYITSYASGARHFTVDDFRLGERQLLELDYPYSNDFEADVSTVVIDGDDSNDTNGKDHWNHEGDWGISTASHNAYDARSGDAFIDNNPEEEDQRRHYSGHTIEMNGALTIPANASEPELTFYYKMDVNDSNDRVFVEIQRSDSTSWNRLRTMSLNDEHDAYTKATLSLSNYKGDTVRIRFRQYFTSYSTGARLFTVDDLRIGDRVVEMYDFPYFNGFEAEESDLANGINGRDQWNHQGDWYFNNITHGDDNQATPKSGSWYLDSNRDDEDQRRRYTNQIVEMNGYVTIPADADGAVVSFDYYYDLIDGNNDNVYLEVQELGSTTWRQIQRFRGTEETSGYVKYEYDLASYLGDTIRVRFRNYITSYSSGPRYMSIDNFKLGYSFIGYWPFEGTLDDLSGSSNNGVAGGSDPIEYFRSNPARSLGATTSTCQYVEFTGNNYMSIPGTEDHHLADEYTVSAWVYPEPDPSTGEHYTTEKSIASKDTNYELHLEGGKVSWWWGGNDRALTSTSTVPLEEWSHIAITYRNGEQNIYINGILDATTDSTTAITTSPYPFYIGTDVSTDTGSIISSRNFVGRIDEVRIYETFLEQSEIEDDINFLRTCEQAIDHILIDHSGAGVACAEHKVNITLCANSDCSVNYTGDSVDVVLQKDVSGTISDLGTFTIPGDTGTLSEAAFTDTTVGTWTYTASADDVTNIQCSGSGGSTSCDFEITTSGLVIEGDSNLAVLSCAESTALQVKAVKSVETGDGLVCETTFVDGTFPLNFGVTLAAGNPAIDTITPVRIMDAVDVAPGSNADVNIPFGSAISSMKLKYDEAGPVEVTISDPSGTLSQTSATINFYPSQLALSWESGDAEKPSATDDDIVVVGQCENESGIITETENYEPSGNYLMSVVRDSPSDTALSNASLSAAGLERFEAEGQEIPVDGTATALDMTGVSDRKNISVTYDEHAQLSITVMDDDYYGQDITMENNTVLAASYVPAYYQASVNIPSLANSCSVFSYIGQPIGFAENNRPRVTLTAYNAKNEVTQLSDFDGNWLFSAATMQNNMSDNTYTDDNTALGISLTSDAPSVTQLTADDSPESIPNDLDGSRSYELSGQQFTYGKTATLVAPFVSDVTVEMKSEAFLDSRGIGIKTVYTEDNDYIGVTFSDLSTDSGNNRYGRLYVENASGSELDPLSWVAQTQYYDGSNWLLAGDDICNQFTESDFTFTDGDNETTSNEFYQESDSDRYTTEYDATTYLTLSGNVVSSDFGYIELPFAATGEGNVGSIYIDVNVTNYPWLQWDWDADGSLDTTLPTTSVIFGRYQGNDRIIYKRER